MEIMGKQKKKKKLFILTILLIASCEMMTVKSELVCETRMPMCIGVCYKSGKCMRCCKHIGFRHGRCSFIHGMGCYCCEDLHPAAAVAAARRTAAPPPLPPPPHA